MEEKVRGFLRNRFESAIVAEEEFRGDVSYRIKPEALVEICQAFMDDSDLDIKYLADITVVDWLDHAQAEQGRFEVVYNLCSLSNKYRFFLKVRLDGDKPTVATLCDLWQGANWMEREAFDLFGIVFEGHPELTKILTPDDLEGHPLRKDFPLTYEEPHFNWNKDLPPEVIK